MALFVFLSHLAAGLLLSLAVVRIGDEARRFLLFNGALALALGAIGLTLRVVGPARWDWGAELMPGTPAIWLSSVAFVVLAAYLLLGAIGKEHRLILRGAAVLAMLGVMVDAYRIYSAPSTGTLSVGPLFHVANSMTSCWLAGSILLAMILGHFYLVLPKLSITPLRSLFRFSLVGLVARIALVTTAGILWWSAVAPASLTVATFLNRGVFVLQRVLFGLLIPASLAWFTYKTIEMRSTQSATGILYVVVFLTLVGEALSVYLSLETRIPL